MFCIIHTQLSNFSGIPRYPLLLSHKTIIQFYVGIHGDYAYISQRSGSGRERGRERERERERERGCTVEAVYKFLYTLLLEGERIPAGNSSVERREKRRISGVIDARNV